jgi:hypothetical protein
MNTLSSANNVQEPKSETPQPKDTYRAPRLVLLGTAVGLVRGWTYGMANDGNNGWMPRN